MTLCSRDPHIRDCRAFTPQGIAGRAGIFSLGERKTHNYLLVLSGFACDSKSRLRAVKCCAP